MSSVHLACCLQWSVLPLLSGAKRGRRWERWATLFLREKRHCKSESPFEKVADVCKHLDGFILFESDRCGFIFNMIQLQYLNNWIKVLDETFTHLLCDWWVCLSCRATLHSTPPALPPQLYTNKRNYLPDLLIEASAVNVAQISLPGVVTMNKITIKSRRLQSAFALSGQG